MANEITEFGQIVTYGGPPLTLLNSTLGGLVKSIFIRKGTGQTRGWAVFDPTVKDFINTYKVMNLGDIVLVNAKVVPMDFTILAGTASSDTGVFVTPTAAQTLFPSILTSRFTFGVPVFTVGGGVVDAQLDGGAFQSLTNFNAATAAVPDAQIQSATHTFTVRVTPSNGVPATVEIPIT